MIFPSLGSLCVSVPVPVPVPVCALVWCALWVVGTDKREQGWFSLGCLVEREEEDPIPRGRRVVSRECKRRRRSKKVVAGPHRIPKYHSDTTFLTYDAVFILCRMSLCLFPVFSSSSHHPIFHF